MKKIYNDASVSVFPKEIAKEKIPAIVVQLLNGASVSMNHHNKKDLVCVTFDAQEYLIHTNDFINAKTIAENIWASYVEANCLQNSYQIISHTLEIHKRAYNQTCNIYEKRFKGKTNVIFVKGDKSGCGYWRMILPASYIDNDYMVDVTNVEVLYEYLLEYDVIVLQRTLNWESLYVIKKLQKLGKKVVYDIDDNLFELPDHNPSKKKYDIDALRAVSTIISTVDRVTVTTQRLKQKLIKFIGKEITDKIFIIPNAINMSKYPERSFDKEEPFRIVWSGSATHEVDFMQCLKGLDDFMKNHKDDDVRIFFFGFCPICVKEILNQEHWQKRIEYVKFQDVETYFELIGEVKADVAIIPLALDDFNIAKSNIKWIEFSMASIPCVISKVPPYSDSINDNEAILVERDGWLGALEDKFATREDEKWTQYVSNSRKKINEYYNIENKKVINLWNKVLTF